MNEQQIIRRYNRLASLQIPGACFVCGSRRPTVNALVQGPTNGTEGIEPRPAVMGRGHGVCRPCIKRGEATALR